MQATSSPAIIVVLVGVLIFVTSIITDEFVCRSISAFTIATSSSSSSPPAVSSAINIMTSLDDRKVFESSSSVSLLSNLTSPTLLNIHLPLKTSSNENASCSHQQNNNNDTITPSTDNISGDGHCSFAMALQGNLALRQHFPETEQIDFFSTHAPHLTLFLTEFQLTDSNRTNNNTEEGLNRILSSVESVASQHEYCRIQWPTTSSSSDTTATTASPLVVTESGYAMIAIEKDTCLQSLSDDIVTQLQPYIDRPPTIPDWVYQLPFWQRWQKIYLIHKYGSPNVFGQYHPHITIGYDNVTPPNERRAVLEKVLFGGGNQTMESTTTESSLSTKGSMARKTENNNGNHTGRCLSKLTSVRVGQVGVGGSVLQNGIVGRFPLLKPQTTPLPYTAAET